MSEIEERYCKCGCGGFVTKKIKVYKNGTIKVTYSTYIKGHHYRNRPLPEEVKNKISKTLTGRVMPEETRIKISKSTKGVSRGKREPFSEEWKHNMSISAINRFTEEYRQKYSEMCSGEGNPFFNKKHTEESKKRIGESNKNKKRPPFSDEHRIKIALAKIGDKHPNWQGGISQDPYCCIWKDKGYKEEIKERDGYICLNPMCNHKSKRLAIHHIDYNKENCHPRNLIALCTSCNAKANFDRDWHTSFYQEIIRRIYQ